MKEISFAWTTLALLEGRKTVTRRDWKYGWARSFEDGELVAAMDRQRRFGGRQVATIRLMQRPYRQNTAQAPDSDWEAEGFAFMEERGLKVEGHEPRVVWQAWKRFHPREMWVVRFDVVGIVSDDPEILRRFYSANPYAISMLVEPA